MAHWYRAGRNMHDLCPGEIAAHSRRRHRRAPLIALRAAPCGDPAGNDPFRDVELSLSPATVRVQRRTGTGSIRLEPFERETNATTEILAGDFSCSRMDPMNHSPTGRYPEGDASARLGTAAQGHLERASSALHRGRDCGHLRIVDIRIPGSRLAKADLRRSGRQTLSVPTVYAKRAPRHPTGDTISLSSRLSEFGAS
jgi:hypothetical protein